MKKQPFIFYLLILLTLNFTGCSSLLPKEQADKALSEFMSQDQHYALFYPGSIKSDAQLAAHGFPDDGLRISQQYGIKDPVVNVIEQCIESAPALAGTIIVQPQKAGGLTLPRSYPVLFFHSDWQLNYRRIPPSFSKYQLRVGIIGKIIPLGQILSGHGPMALKTASWEGNCYFKVFDGKFIALEEWEADDGKLLHQGVKEAQNYCADKFIAEFAERLANSH